MKIHIDVSSKSSIDEAGIAGSMICHISAAFAHVPIDRAGRGIGAPPERDLFSRKDVLVGRSSDGGRENIGIIDRVSFRISVQYIEESIEVVRVLVDVNDSYVPLVANARSQASGACPHRSQRIFPLLRTLVNDNDWIVSRPERAG